MFIIVLHDKKVNCR